MTEEKRTKGKCFFLFVCFSSKDVDVQSQIDECIVQTQVCGITKTLNDNLRSAVVNPNEVILLVFNKNRTQNQTENLH